MWSVSISFLDFHFWCLWTAQTLQVLKPLGAGPHPPGQVAYSQHATQLTMHTEELTSKRNWDWEWCLSKKVMQKKKGGGEEQKMRGDRKKGAGRKRKCLPRRLYDEQNCLDKAFVRNVILSANAYSLVWCHKNKMQQSSNVSLLLLCCFFVLCPTKSPLKWVSSLF